MANPWPGVVALSLAASIAALQNTAVVPLLPVLQKDLGVSLTAATWTLTVSLLVSAVATPLLSRFGDMYGRRRMIIGALAALIAGSVIAAWAPSYTWLMVGRVLQGVVAALFPLAIGLVRDVLPRKQLATGIGVLSATMGFGSGFGMILAGVVGDWHAVFWVTAAIAVVAGAFVLVSVHDAAVPAHGRPDLLGAGLMAGWLVLLLLAVSQGRTWGWTSSATLGSFALAVVLAVVWVFVERRTAEPLVDLAMLVDRGTVGATVASALMGFAFFAGLTGISTYTQLSLGSSTLEVGVFLLPSTVFMLVISLFVGRAVRRYSASAVVAGGSVVVAVAALWLALEHRTPSDIYIGSSLLGIGLGFAYSALGTMAVENVAPDRTASAAGVNALVRIVGGSTAGTAIAAIVAAVPGEGGFTWVFAASALASLTGALFAAAFGLLNRRRLTDRMASATI
ncbi:MFS transporter [Nonomuraea sp. NPDC050556]|uniref:MFS transporter n=1 Tax=Nonomuraea sp. NPDC050556 TaxID=3364369 RepID=UPI0037A8572C